MKRAFASTFVLRVCPSPNEPQIVIHNLKTGERQTFSDWQALVKFVEQQTRAGLR